MASSFPKFLLALILIAATASVAHCNIIIDGKNVSQIRVSGFVACSPTGLPVPGKLYPGIRGADVCLSCNGGKTCLSTALTNLAGFYQLVLSFIDGLAFDTSKCGLSVKLPTGTCTVYLPTGNLKIGLKLIGFVQGVVGLIALLLGIRS